jgi:hypothetical protein
MTARQLEVGCFVIYQIMYARYARAKSAETLMNKGIGRTGAGIAKKC